MRTGRSELPENQFGREEEAKRAKQAKKVFLEAEQRYCRMQRTPKRRGSAVMGRNGKGG